jgi:cation:H+ antiporter
VAFGTSMPELVVNIIASLNGNTEIAIGNILGSNISNIFLILGVSAAIYPLVVHRNTVWKEIPFALLSVFALFFLANDQIFDILDFSSLSRGDGLTLLLFFAIFLYYTFILARNGKSEATPAAEVEEVEEMPTWQSIVWILAGMLGLVYGGQWIVDGAVEIASNFGLSQSLIGLTVVAIGTSLPELATSAVAAMKKQTDIAIGNVVGSNIFNVLWILGLSATINPIPFQADTSNFDLLVNLFANILLFGALFVGRKHLLERWQGYFFVFLYIAYTVYLVLADLEIILF